jgi:hypothetical protein
MKTGLLVALMFVLAISSQALLAAPPENGVKVADGELAKLTKAYDSATTVKEKTAALENLLKQNTVEAHAAFYKLLRAADETDQPSFKSAVSRAGTVELLINFGPYMKRIQNHFRDELKSMPDAGEKELAELQKKAQEIIQPLMKNVNALAPEFAVITEKNKQLLLAVLEKAFLNENGERVDLSGPLLGFVSMKEEGAKFLLQVLDNDRDSKGLLVLVVPTFGPFIVEPTLKQYENPASTKKEKDTAGVAMMMFADNEPVYDKVVEAFKHGRYFGLQESKRDKDGKIVISSLEEALSMSQSWWGSNIKFAYRKNEQFIKYVGRKYLPDPNFQEAVIELLAGTNLGTAAPYFMALDIDKLSAKSLDMLKFVSSPSPIDKMPGVNGEKRDYTAEKFLIFSKIFAKIDEKARAEQKMMYPLFDFPPEYIEAFVAGHAKDFTEEEKKTAVYMCISAVKKVPKTTQKKVFDILRKGASKALASVIDYAENQYHGTDLEP